jgi:phosphopantothenoylcysteine decarboxylase/phosphopantothenate--cysteine ligase
MDSNRYQGKTIVVGLTGGIACYKAIELVSFLRQRGADVQVIMTKAACKFVTPLTLQTVSNNQVAVELFDPVFEWNVKHVSFAEKADIMVIIPATANFIGKAAGGIADDLLTTTIIATKVPILIAPAMNVNMYSNPIVQQNILRLQEFGYHFIEPEEGFLACGVSGKGRLAPIPMIIEGIERLLFTTHNRLAGMKVLVTAGGTQEPIDPVRYISNRSSGKMGYAVCEALAEEGAEVVLVTGPAKLAAPKGTKVINVVTAEEMYDACLKEFSTVQAVIKAAAVADYRPKAVASQKIKKSDRNLVIELEKNPDILRELGKLKKEQVIIGFAAETEELLKHAQQKLQAKKLDMIVANDVSLPNSGFNADDNQVTFLQANGDTEQLPLLNKKEVARRIVEKLIKLLHKE